MLKALDAALPEVSLSAVSAETLIEASRAAREGGLVRVDGRPGLSARRADALGVVAESVLKHGLETLGGGERHQIVVHVDVETLKHSSAGRCELEDGPALPVESARRLACDASVVTLIENEQSEPLNIGRKTRTIPPAIRRALNSRDRGCRFPGCTHQRFIDGHHIQHWADGGHTNLANLVSLCRFHHRLVHEGAVVVQVLDDGALRFLKPNGESLESTASGHTRPLGDWSALVATHRHDLVHIDEHTAATRWRGETIDYGLAIEVLLQRARRMDRASQPANVSAETCAPGSDA